MIAGEIWFFEFFAEIINVCTVNEYSNQRKLFTTAAVGCV